MNSFKFAHVYSSSKLDQYHIIKLVLYNAIQTAVDYNNELWISIFSAKNASTLGASY